MPEADDRPRVPSALKRLVLDYQNTCVFMLKVWRRLMLILAFAFPAAFYLRETSFLQAAINAAGMWCISAVMSRFLVLEFRLLRARRVAQKIDKHVPPAHPSRQAVIDWIREHNDGNFLHSLLRKLGASPERPLSDLPYDPVAMINGILGKLGDKHEQTTQTYVYTTETRVLNDNGEWETVESHSSEGSGTPPEEELQKALDDIEPPQGFKPIPISAPKKRRKKKRRRKFMPLDPEMFEPESRGATTEGEKRK